MEYLNKSERKHRETNGYNNNNRYSNILIIVYGFCIIYNQLTFCLFVALKFYDWVKVMVVCQQIQINTPVIIMELNQMINQLNILKATGL